MENAVISLKDGSWGMDHTPSQMARSMFFYVQSMGYFICEPTYMTARKDYNTMLMAYTLKGQGILKYRDASYLLNPDSVFFIDCMDYQYYGVFEGGPWDFKWLHFNGCESRSYFDRIYENIGPVVDLGPNSQTPRCWDEIAEMMRIRDHRFDVIASMKILEILTELLLESYGGDEGEGDIPDYVKETIEVLESRYASEVSLDLLAEDVGVSKYHLSRVFKRYTGFSPYEYLLNYRLSQSKVLLRSTDMPIYEIANKVGFDSSSHFIKLFHRQEGVTPLKFREYWR